MKIGYFVSHFPYKARLEHEQYAKQYTHTGTIAAAYSLAINMAKRGHEINIFTSSIDNRDCIEKHDNLIIYRYGTNFRMLSANFCVNMFIKSLKQRLDILHTHLGAPPAADAALWHAKRKKIPLILTYHADQDPTYGPLFRRLGVSFYNKYLLSRLFSSTKTIIVTSQHYINESKFLEKFQDKISVVPNGINLNDFDVPYSKEECRKKLGLPLGENIILFVGLLTPFKGPDVLIKAIPQVIKRVKNTKLLLVGEGPFRQKLEQERSRLGCEKSIRFEGFVTDSLKALYYKASDVFVLPSISTAEAFGIVNLEAMASGIPVISTKVGGIPSIINNNVNGLLIEPKDEIALADSIIYLLENQDIRSKLAKEGFKRVQNYSWKNIAKETERIYTCLLQEVTK